VAGTTLSPDARRARLPGRCYRVGGSVRDELLGEPAGDADWVVVGATPQDLLAAGFKPVGRDFPVFLHPDSGDEYALARTERKSAPGYRGFVVHADPAVTLEEDLARRDLTINAMARGEDGRLVDPYGGARDLAEGTLRHVSPAFVEDPVRLLRVARFAARWPHFRVAPETAQLLQQMVAAGEVDALVRERVWQELARGLMEQRPSRLVQVLADCGALPRLLPGLALGDALLQRLDRCAAAASALEVRFACLAYGSPGLADHLQAPRDCADLALMLQRESDALLRSGPGPEERLAMFERCDAWRRAARFAHLLQAVCALDGCADDARPVQDWRLALQAALAVDSAAVAAAAAARGWIGPAVGAAIRQARLDAITARLPG
jgi:tRNA nucleotidyltransferase (CCA-adding enzyme)